MYWFLESLIWLFTCEQRCNICRLPSGVVGSSVRLNQSSSIASYVTLRRPTSAAGIKVRGTKRKKEKHNLRPRQIEKKEHGGGTWLWITGWIYVGLGLDRNQPAKNTSFNCWFAISVTTPERISLTHTHTAISSVSTRTFLCVLKQPTVCLI